LTKIYWYAGKLHIPPKTSDLMGKIHPLKVSNL